MGTDMKPRDYVGLIVIFALCEMLQDSLSQNLSSRLNLRPLLLRH